MFLMSFKTDFFKTWMCGGHLEFVPCSRVGHIFRSGHPYNMTGQSDQHLSVVERNSIRLAQVWLDEYKEVFYMHKQHLIQVNTTVPYIYWSLTRVYFKIQI